MKIGIDLGGTKTEGVLLDSSGKVLERVRQPTPQSEGYEAILAGVESIVEELEKRAGTSFPLVGIGTPGTLDTKTNTLRGSNTVCLNGRSIGQDLETRLQKKVLIENDANCFALAEATLGAAQGGELVFGVILGTGVGGGIVYQGHCLSGRQGIAGEWGHIQLEREGEPCYCGRRGCVETEISGPALERYYSKLSGKRLPLSEIVAASDGGEIDAEATLQHLFKQFGRALAIVVNILDPDVIVLGGGVSNISRLTTDGVLAVQESVFHPHPELRIVKNALGDSAGVFGAAMLTETTRVTVGYDPHLELSTDRK